MRALREGRLRLRFFLSSPGDLRRERDLAQKIIEQTLQKNQFVRDKAACEAVRWDDPAAGVPMPANHTPQQAVDRGLPMPGECDVVIVMLWSRMGTPLPEEYSRSDGSRYLSGTEWEYENAISARPQPHVLVYRCRAPITLDEVNRDEQGRQFDRVKEFFSRFSNPDGSLRGGFAEYETPEQFGERLLSDLTAFVNARLEETSRNKVVENRSAGRRPSHLRSAWSRDFRPGPLKQEPLVTVPQARLDNLRDSQGRLEAYISGYVACRELSDVCAAIVLGIEDARGSNNRFGDSFHWRHLCRDLEQARDEVEGLPDLFKRECEGEIQEFVQRLNQLDQQLQAARDCGQRDAYESAVSSSAETLKTLKRTLDGLIRDSKNETRRLLKEIEGIIQRILEWMPLLEKGQSLQSQPKSFEAKIQRPIESVDQKASDRARISK